MTNNEVIKELSVEYLGDSEKIKEAKRMRMAIKALEQEPCDDCRNCKKWNECPCGKEGHENGTSIGYSIGDCKDYEPCEDCISREAVDIVEDMHDLARSDVLSDTVKQLRDLSSVQPTRPTGKWAYKMQVMNNPYTYQCSVCKGWERDKTKYCPNCGAKMVEPQESENKE